MATFPDDFIQFGNPPTGHFNLVEVGLEWPPPDHLSINGKQYMRISHSPIPDEVRAGTNRVVRGANYLELITITDEGEAIVVDGESLMIQQHDQTQGETSQCTT